MRIPTDKSSKKIFAIISIALILLLATGVAAYYFKVGPFSQNLDNSIDLNPATDDQKNAGNDIKQGNLDQVKSGKGNTGSDPSPAPQPVEGSDIKSVGMEISAANQNDSTLQIRTFIQTITSTGTCDLSMKSDQNMTYTANVGVQALSSTSTCKGFDIPVDQLYPGTWMITINFSNDTLTASTSKEITIK